MPREASTPAGKTQLGKGASSRGRWPSQVLGQLPPRTLHTRQGPCAAHTAASPALRAKRNAEKQHCVEEGREKGRAESGEGRKMTCSPLKGQAS